MRATDFVAARPALGWRMQVTYTQNDDLQGQAGVFVFGGKIATHPGGSARLVLASAAGVVIAGSIGRVGDGVAVAVGPPRAVAAAVVEGGSGL